MKADVIHALSGLTVLAVPGVNTLTHLKLTLEKLRSQGVTEIKTAFDMDFSTNIHVQNGFNNRVILPARCVQPSALQPSFWSVLDIQRNLRFWPDNRR